VKLLSAAGEVIALAARLSPAPRLFFETASGVEEPPPGRGRRYWIVARSLCRFFKVPLLPGASRARQLDALGLEVKRVSPFDDTGWHLHLGADSASIWVWDQGLTRSAAAAAGIDIGRLRVVPETAMQPPGEDGPRLIETLDGVEGQSWTAGSPVASRWWRDLPDARAWMMFQRGAGLPPDRLAALVPQPMRLPWLARPWTTTRRPGSFDLTRVDTRLIAASVAAAIIVAYGYQGVEWFRVDRDVARLTDEIARRSEAIEPLLQARTRALDSQSAIRVLHDLDRFPSQLALMARVAELLPRDRTRLTAWIYDRGQLELGIEADRPLDVVKLVRSLEGLDHFKSVAAERTGTDNRLRLHVTLDPL
jgi:hypothetical protein